MARRKRRGWFGRFLRRVVKVVAVVVAGPIGGALADALLGSETQHKSTGSDLPPNVESEMDQWIDRFLIPYINERYGVLSVINPREYLSRSFITGFNGLITELTALKAYFEYQRIMPMSPEAGMLLEEKIFAIANQLETITEAWKSATRPLGSDYQIVEQTDDASRFAVIGTERLAWPSGRSFKIRVFLIGKPLEQIEIGPEILIPNTTGGKPDVEHQNEVITLNDRPVLVPSSPVSNSRPVETSRPSTPQTTATSGGFASNRRTVVSESAAQHNQNRENAASSLFSIKNIAIGSAIYFALKAI